MRFTLAATFAANVFLVSAGVGDPTTCSDGSGPVVLAGNFTDAPEGFYGNEWFSAQLPFEVCVFDGCSSNVSLNTNGYFMLGGSYGFAPDYAPPAISGFAGIPTIAAYWTYQAMCIQPGEPNYISYTVCGTSGSRTVTFDFRFGKNAPQEDPLPVVPVYSYSTTFYEAYPSRQSLQYLTTPDKGADAMVGAVYNIPDDGDDDQWLEYSFTQPNIPDGLELIWDYHTHYYGPAADFPQ